MAVPYKPANTQAVVPYLVAADAKQLIDFIVEVFDAKQKSVSLDSGGKIMNAEYWIDDTLIMISDSRPDVAPAKTMFYLFVPDCDAVYKKAIENGAKSLMEPADQFYGDRTAGIEGPMGNQWWLSTHIEDVTEEEIKRRFAEMQQN